MIAKMEREVVFEKRDHTRISMLRDVHGISNCVMMTSERFGRFVRDVLNDLKLSKCTYYNSVVGQLITAHQERTEQTPYTETLARVLLANNVIVTNIEESVFLRKLKINKFTDNIDYLILPNFTLWDHNFLVFMNKKFNSKKPGGLVNIWGSMQKIPLTQGVIKDLIQNKNGYAGQYLYSTFLNTASFYANVQCFNGINEVKPPKPSAQRYYGRRVPNAKVWNTRHPNISQLSTQFSRVKDHVDDGDVNWNIEVGLGTFVGANRDCDGDKEVITFLPYPNSLVELESLLYCDPKYSFLCFDKNKLSFVSQQIYYLYKNIGQVEREFKRYPLAWTVWRAHRHLKLSSRLDNFFRDITLMLSSNFSTLLFQRLCEIIDKEEMVCCREDVDGLSGCFEDIVRCGAKGSDNLVQNTKQYMKTSKENVDTVAQRAINGLNSHITSHGRVKFSGGDIYHNTVVFLNLYIKNYNICYKQDQLRFGDISHIPSDFLFPTHLLDIVLSNKEK